MPRVSTTVGLTPNTILIPFGIVLSPQNELLASWVTRIAPQSSLRSPQKPSRLYYHSRDAAVTLQNHQSPFHTSHGAPIISSPEGLQLPPIGVAHPPVTMFPASKDSVYTRPYPYPKQIDRPLRPSEEATFPHVTSRATPSPHITHIHEWIPQFCTNQGLTSTRLSYPQEGGHAMGITDLI